MTRSVVVLGKEMAKGTLVVCAGGAINVDDPSLDLCSLEDDAKGDWKAGGFGLEKAMTMRSSCSRP